ncbi:flagellar hook-length control protein FliK [Dickeya lacustris]|uniref:flagellar hook-length control protein FliK n=1 Tax=Dickeya lacustris TaxID=2259638 RepID=UPI0022BA5618|nr:flagellar hook-length control protein FliK [Dickeya lacustris]
MGNDAALPENFVQLLSQKLSALQSSRKVAVSDQESAEFKDALAKSGIDANSEELNSILTALTSGTLTVSDLQADHSLESLLAKSQKKADVKDEKTVNNDALAMQALFAMIPQQTIAKAPAVEAGNMLSDGLATFGTVKNGASDNNALLNSLLSGKNALSQTDVSLDASDKSGGLLVPSALSTSAATASTAVVPSPAKGSSAVLGENTFNALSDNNLLSSRKDDSISNPTAASAPADATLSSSMQTLSSLFANNAAPTQPAAQHLTSQITAPVGTQQWNDALGQQVVMFTRNGQQTAELKLHPEELGSLHIMLKIEDNQAQIHLVSGSSQVRSALESALPHLRNAMAESGINLGQSSVGADAGSWQQSQQQLAGNTGGNGSNNASSYQQQFGQSERTTESVSALPVPATLQSIATGRNGVDIFA